MLVTASLFLNRKLFFQQMHKFQCNPDSSSTLLLSALVLHISLKTCDLSTNCTSFAEIKCEMSRKKLSSLEIRIAKINLVFCSVAIPSF